MDQTETAERADDDIHSTPHICRKMDCPKCNREYCEPDRLPRILTQCGHTICQVCLSSTFSGSEVICQQCQRVTQTNSVAALPVNIALMRLKQKDAQTDICEKHSKQMEAYCASDQELLCVSCILEDGHKRHDITAISKAASKQRETLRNGKLSALLTEQALRKKESDFQAFELALRQDHSAAVQSFTELFSMLLEVIQARQAELEERVATILTSELDKLKSSRDGNTSQLSQIKRFLDEVESMENDTDIAVLQKVKAREGLMKTSNVKVTAVITTKPFAGFSKEGELNNLWKIVKTKMAPVQTNAQKPSKTPIPSNPKPDPKKFPMKSKDPPQTPFEQLVYKVKTDIPDPVKPPPQSKKPKPGPFKLDLETSDTSLTVDGGKGDNNTSMQSWKGDLSPIAKGGVSFGSIDDDVMSVKSVDLSAFCRTQQAAILTFGGLREQGVATIDRFDCVSEEWTSIGETATARAQFGCFWWDGRPILIGGKINGKRTALSEEFSLTDGRSKDVDLKLPSPRSGFAVVLVSSDLYVVGGSDGVPLKSLEIWNGTEWAQGPSMKIRRDELAVVLGPDLQLYALGGYGGTEMVSQRSCESYNLVSRLWSPLPSMSFSRRALGAVALPNGIYAIGGYDGQHYLNTVEKLDITRSEWTTLAPMMSVRCSFVAVVSADCKKIVVIGGYNGQPIGLVESYGVGEDVWRQLPSLPQPRFMHCGLLLSD